MAHTYDFVLNPFSFNTSGDMIFSGHTRYLMVGLCVMSSLVSKKNWKVTVPCFVCELLCCCCAIYCFFLVPSPVPPDA